MEVWLRFAVMWSYSLCQCSSVNASFEYFSGLEFCCTIRMQVLFLDFEENAQNSPTLSWSKKQLDYRCLFLPTNFQTHLNKIFMQST